MDPKTLRDMSQRLMASAPRKIEIFTGGQLLEQAAREIERLQASDAALGAIHSILSDHGIPPGHIVTRFGELLRSIDCAGGKP